MHTPDTQGLAAHSVEKKEAKEYNEPEILNLAFWSIYVSQGSPELQKDALEVLFNEYPTTVPAVRKFQDDLGDVRLTWHTHEAVIAFEKRIADYTRSPQHTRPNKEFTPQLETFKALNALFSAANVALPERREGIHPDPETTLYEFVEQSIARDVALRAIAKYEPSIKKNRERVGWSFICRYGLSALRDAHLAGKDKNSPPQPPEFHTVWKSAGDYIRAHYPAFTPETQMALSELVTLYKETTNEEIALP